MIYFSTIFLAAEETMSADSYLEVKVRNVKERVKFLMNWLLFSLIRSFFLLFSFS